MINKKNETFFKVSQLRDRFHKCSSLFCFKLHQDVFEQFQGSQDRCVRSFLLVDPLIAFSSVNMQFFVKEGNCAPTIGSPQAFKNKHWQYMGRLKRAETFMCFRCVGALSYTEFRWDFRRNASTPKWTNVCWFEWIDQNFRCGFLYRPLRIPNNTLL